MIWDFSNQPAAIKLVKVRLLGVNFKGLKLSKLEGLKMMGNCNKRQVRKLFRLKIHF